MKKIRTFLISCLMIFGVANTVMIAQAEEQDGVATDVGVSFLNDGPTYPALPTPPPALPTPPKGDGGSGQHLSWTNTGSTTNRPGWLPQTGEKESMYWIIIGSLIISATLFVIYIKKIKIKTTYKGWD